MAYTPRNELERWLEDREQRPAYQPASDPNPSAEPSALADVLRASHQSTGASHSPAATTHSDNRTDGSVQSCLVCGNAIPVRRARCERCEPPPLPADYVAVRDRLRDQIGGNRS